MWHISRTRLLTNKKARKSRVLGFHDDHEHAGLFQMMQTYPVNNPGDHKQGSEGTLRSASLLTGVDGVQNEGVQQDIHP